ncbi:MAG: SH3 domain-containing protein [Cyanobium sp.]
MISGKPGFKNLRSGPGTRYDVVKEIATGDTVEVIGSSTDIGGYQWVRIRTSDGVEAWIASQLITIQ